MIRLKEERKRNKYTQEEVAQLLGTSQQAISKYENGLREPDLTTLIELAKLYNVSLDYLVGFSEISEHGVSISTLSESEKKAQELFHNLSNDNQILILAKMIELKKEQENFSKESFRLSKENKRKNA